MPFLKINFSLMPGFISHSQFDFIGYMSVLMSVSHTIFITPGLFGFLY